MEREYTISCGDVSARIAAAGAELVSLTRQGTEYLWYGDPTFWPRHAPVLFPIVGCLREGRATSSAGEIRLARHGLARLFDHELVEHSDDRVHLRLCSNDKTRKLFPFAFTFDTIYEITANGELSQTHIVGCPEDTLPFTLGGHPAFVIPRSGEDSELNDHVLEFSRAWSATTPAMIDGGLHDFSRSEPVITEAAELPLSYELIEKHATIVLSDVPDSWVRLRSRTTNHGIEMSFPGFTYFGIWTAANKAPFVALEPWVGCATCADEDNRFESKRGTQVLTKGQRASFTFTMRPF